MKSSGPVSMALTAATAMSAIARIQTNHFVTAFQQSVGQNLLSNRFECFGKPLQFGGARLPVKYSSKQYLVLERL